MASWWRDGSRESKDPTQTKKGDAANCVDGAVYTVSATHSISSRFVPKPGGKPGRGTAAFRELMYRADGSRAGHTGSFLFRRTRVRRRNCVATKPNDGLRYPTFTSFQNPNRPPTACMPGCGRSYDHATRGYRLPSTTAS